MPRAPFPSSALDVLRAARFAPAARPAVDARTGSLIWDDERFVEFFAECHRRGNPDAWRPFAFRDSVVLGEERPELREAWEELEWKCPDWPGLRRERRRPDLAGFLRRERQASDEDRPPAVRSNTWRFYLKWLARMTVAGGAFGFCFGAMAALAFGRSTFRFDQGFAFVVFAVILGLCGAVIAAALAGFALALHWCTTPDTPDAPRRERPRDLRRASPLGPRVIVFALLAAAFAAAAVLLAFEW